MNGNWFVADLEDGRRVRGRLQMDSHAQSGMYPFKIDIHWKKMGDEFDHDLTAKFEEQMMFVFEKDRDAFLTLVSEGSNEFVFSWYVRNIQEFGNKMNNLLLLFPPLPITVFSMDDPEWTSYYSIQKVVNSFIN